MTTQVKSFLDSLFVDGDEGQIIFAKKMGDTGFARVGAFDLIAEAEGAVGDVDLYLKINRMHLDKIVARNSRGIGGKSEISTVRVIGIDVDTAKKHAKYPARDEVLARLDMGLMRHAPSVIVSSDGSTDGGLHLYWCLDQPVVIGASWEKTVQYVNAIARQLREELAEMMAGYVVDHCENIERLFRVAGSLRTDGRRVEVIGGCGAKYRLEDLMWYPVERGSCLMEMEQESMDRADSPILIYLEEMGITTVEDYMRDRMGWRQVDDTHWIRPNSSSGMPSGQVFKGKNGMWGLTVRSGGVPGLTALDWYSLAHLYTACEFGGDWRLAATYARRAIDEAKGVGGGAAGDFVRHYSDFDKHQTNGRAAAIWCYENIHDCLYVPDQKEWLVWNGSAWVAGEERVFETVSRCMLDVSMEHKHLSGIKDAGAKAKAQDAWTKWARSFLNAREYSGLKKILESTLYRMSADFHEEPETLYTPSFKINLRTGERSGAASTNFNRVTTLIDPLCSGDCPRWLAFLDEVMAGDPEMVAYLKRVCGYFLTGGVDEQVMFLLHGSGQNGKSVFTHMLETVMAGYAAQLDQSAIMGVLDQHPTAIASLFRRRLALASETDQGCTLREHIVKRLTGVDTLVARRMHENFWTFTPTHKLVISTNNIPIIKGSDEGIWRRLRMIKFNIHFGNPDKHLIRKLKLETPGILAWMLEGAQEFLRDGLLSPDPVTKAGKELREQMDIVGGWIAENCEISSSWVIDGSDFVLDGDRVCQADFFTYSSILYDDFKLYCQRFGLPTLSVTSFGTRLTDKGFNSVNKGKRKLKSRVGIILKSVF